MTYPTENDRNATISAAPPPPTIFNGDPYPLRVTYAGTGDGSSTPAPTPSTSAPTGAGGGYWMQVPIDSTAPYSAGGASSPPAPTGRTALDQLLAVLSYGGDVYQSIPALQYIMGQLSEGEFNTVTTQDTVVPQLGITLPAPGKLNYQMLNNVKQNSPASFELLKSLFAAGNRDLDNEMAITRQAAPLGSAYEGTLINT